MSCAEVCSSATGSSGFDWFLFDDTRDRATDLHDEAFTNDLPFITGP